MEKYCEYNTIGEGTYGIVTRAKNIETGEIVALKKIRLQTHKLKHQFPSEVLREFKTLQHTCHPNVITLYDVFPHGSSLVLVLDYMKTDLSTLMSRLDAPLPESHVKCYMQMILRGLAHCHSLNIIHRDIKPANLLIGENGELKLSDFGLARMYVGPKQCYSHEVATRAPELLYGSRNYDFSVDIWATGCVFYELLNFSPMFPGVNDINQLHQVLSIRGTPNETTWPDVKELPDYSKIEFGSYNPIPLEKLLPNASKLAVDLLDKLLILDPKKRITAKDALLHPWFFKEPLPVHHTQLYIPPKKEKVDMMKWMNAPFEFPKEL